MGISRKLYEKMRRPIEGFKIVVRKIKITFLLIAIAVNIVASDEFLFFYDDDTVIIDLKPQAVRFTF